MGKITYHGNSNGYNNPMCNEHVDAHYTQQNTVTDKDRLTGKKHVCFIKFLHVSGMLHERIKTQRSDQGRKVLCLLDKEIKHL